MKIKPDIDAIDDDGLLLSSSKVDLHKIPPVLSIEASTPLCKRLNFRRNKKNIKKRNFIDTHYTHAGQIYGELLGHVCHAPLPI